MELTGALAQLGALALLSVLALVLALLLFVDGREVDGGLAEVVGPLSADGFRQVVVGFSFIAAALVTVGVGGLLLAREQAYLADVAAGFLVAALAVVLLTLALVFVLLWRQ